MKAKFEVSVTGSRMCGGCIATVKTIVEFDIDRDPIKDFYDKARHGIFMCGYNILHWGAVNGVEGGRCVFAALDKERLVRRVLRDLAEYKQFADMLKAVEASEKSGVASEHTHLYDGTWRYDGWEKHRILEAMACHERRVAVTDLVLDELGYDPSDREGVARVCKNLGIDAYPGNGTC